MTETSKPHPERPRHVSVLHEAARLQPTLAGTEIRIAVVEYKHRARVDLRVFGPAKDGSGMKATHRGILIHADQLPAVQAALAEAGRFIVTGATLRPDAIQDVTEHDEEEPVERDALRRANSVMARYGE